jgi:hypothetical protein
MPWCDFALTGDKKNFLRPYIREKNRTGGGSAQNFED